jgi:hypothetical protein
VASQLPQNGVKGKLRARVPRPGRVLGSYRKRDFSGTSLTSQPLAIRNNKQA